MQNPQSPVSRCDLHHPHTQAAPIHYLTYLEGKLKTHMHKRHKLGSADHSGYYYNSWQRLDYAIRPTPPYTTVSSEADDPPSQLANKKSAIPFKLTQSSPSNIR
eukprot:169951-Pelagomonas_calceolata.AAC.1